MERKFNFYFIVHLNDGQQEKLADLVSVTHQADLLRYGDKFPFYNEEDTLNYLIHYYCLKRGKTLDEALDADLAYQRKFVASHIAMSQELHSEDDGEAGDVPARNPSPEAAPDEEPETVSNAEEPETLVSVCDASGAVREVTLDEAEEMREAAQGIYERQPPEPQLIEDRTDAYFRLLGVADWPETPCTGDYGLSDCLAEPSEETLDFVDAFFVHEDAS